jgi:hypothetical protein
MRYVPLTDLQADRANRWIHMGCFHEATHLQLSPRQEAILMKSYSNVSSRTDGVDVPIVDPGHSAIAPVCQDATVQNHNVNRIHEYIYLAIHACMHT